MRKYHPNPEEYPIVFYDLGLSDANRAKLATEVSSRRRHRKKHSFGSDWQSHSLACLCPPIQAAPGVEMRTFKFDDYPDYFKIVGNTRGEYAWKPVIVMTVMLQTEKPVFWYCTPPSPATVATTLYCHMLIATLLPTYL